jgi:hypothetical protein
MGRQDDIEDRLRKARAEPRAGFVEDLATRAVPQAARSSGWSRAAFAASLTVMVLGTFASFGGLSYAASGGTHALGTIEKVTTSHRLVVSHSSATAQYPHASSTKSVKHVTTQAARSRSRVSRSWRRCCSASH